MLYALRDIKRSEWDEYLESLINELKGLKEIIFKYDEYREQENRHSEWKYYTFKRLKNIEFVGKEDEDMPAEIYFTEPYISLLKETEPYATLVDEAIEGLIRKIENTINNLDHLETAVEVAAESTTSPLSFVYKPDARKGDRLTDFYNELKDLRFIENTTIGTFRNVFYGKKVLKKIIWSGTPAALNYLIKEIHNNKRKVEPKGRKLWSTVCNCFERPGGVQFKPAPLRQEKPPKNTTVLDKIISRL